MYKFKPEITLSGLLSWLIGHTLLTYAFYAIYGVSFIYVFGQSAYDGADTLHRLMLIFLVYLVIARGIALAGVSVKHKKKAQIAIIKMELVFDIKNNCFTQSDLEKAYRAWDHELVNQALAELGEHVK